MQLGKMWNWDDDYNDYSYEKFYLGGSTSMRAWDVLRFNNKDGIPRGETVRLMTNLEFRADIYKLIGLTIFSDGGILTSQISSVSFSNMKWNVGLGMTIRTPLGPFRVDYAHRLQENKESRVQLGVQNLF